MLKREGREVGKKLVYRLYHELGPQMRTRKRRKLARLLEKAGGSRRAIERVGKLDAL
jgi:hypothetical protein